jgi:replicative DNA helicase
MLQAVGAERAVLSILMKDPQLVFEIDDVLAEADFTNGGAQVIYRSIKEILLSDKEAVIDHYTLISHAEKNGIDNFLSLTHNGELLEALSQTQVNPKSLGRHISAIKTMSIKRNAIGMLDDLKDNVEDFAGDPVDLKNMVEDRVFREMRALDSGDEEIVRMDSAYEETINAFAEQNAILGLDVGMPKWQRDCGSIRNGTVTGVFARAKTGKSQFSAWCGTQAAIYQQLPVLYLDTELQLRDQQMRLTSILSGIPFNEVESGAWKADKEKVEKIKECFGLVKDSPFYYKNISGRSVNHVIPVIRKFFHKFVGESKGDEVKCLVIYDYIKLMSMSDIKDAAEWQVLGFLLSAIHDVAAQLNIPILALGQLNREALRMDNEYTVSGSDRITHNLDSLTIFRQKKQEELEADGESRGTHIFKVPIARKGAGHTDGDHVNVTFLKDRGQFKEDKRRSEIMEALKASRPVRDRLEEMNQAPLGSLRESDG